MNLLIEKLPLTAYLFVYASDSVGSLTNVDYPGGTTDLQFKFDALNRVTSLVDAAGTTKYAYTAGNQFWTEA